MKSNVLEKVKTYTGLIFMFLFAMGCVVYFYVEKIINAFLSVVMWGI